MSTIEVEEAIEWIESSVSIKTQVIEVNLLASNHHIVAEDIFAPISVPNFPKSAMDGYAVRSFECTGASRECPIEMEVVGELLAGEYKAFSPKANQTVRVMTGAYIPGDFDAVIRQEDTNYGEKHVEIFTDIKHFENYCVVGEDIMKYQLVIPQYTRLTSIHIGVIASLGIAAVKIIQPVRVSIISTGNELTKVGEHLQKGKIYDSISYTLAARMTANDIDIVSMDHCEDDIDKLVSLIEERIDEVDILITTGGISVGKKDIVIDVMDRLLTRRLFKGVNMQPGTPVLANIYKGKIILSNSGNPFAAYANFEIFFWPIVAKLLNNNEYKVKTKEAILDSDYNKISKTRRFIRASYKNGHVTLPTIKHASSVLSSMIGCNCFIDISPDTTIARGDIVKIRYIKEEQL